MEEQADVAQLFQPHEFVVLASEVSLFLMDVLARCLLKNSFCSWILTVTVEVE